MRFSRSVSLLASFVLGCLIVFSAASINVAAESVPSGGHYLTVQETRDFIGSSIPFSYYNGSQYVDAVATYDSSVSCTAETSENPSGFPVGATFLRYKFQAPNINSSPNYVTFRITPTYSIFDTEYLYTCFAVAKVTSVNVSPSAYQSPNSDWFISGSNVNFANSNESAVNSGTYSFLTFGNINALYVPIVHRQQNTFSAYAVDFEASGISTTNGIFYVMCPYVSGAAFGQSGSFVSGSGSGGSSSGTNTNINIDIDLDETNGLLDGILSGISGLADTLVHVFVPSEEQMQDFHDDLVSLLDDTFSGQDETADALEAVKDSISDASPVNYLVFPAVNVGGFSIPQQNVNLVPIPELLPYIKLGFNILATCAVINLVRLKIDEVLHGKVVVESDEVDIS